MKCNVGFNWLRSLSLELPHIQFINKGENGSQIPGVIDIIAQGFDFKPSAIICHIGGNDVSCSYNQIPALNASIKGRKPTNQSVFSQEFSEMLNLLAKFDVPIGVFNLKPQGEDLSSPLNLVIRAYNALISELVAACPNATLLDVYSPFAAEIARQRPLMAYRAPVASIADVVRPGRIVRVMLLRLLLLGLASWDWLGRREGFAVSCDGLHCNERAGAILGAAARRFLEERLPRAA